ncbi:MAG: ECF transporter S component [Anaerolineales bacterium]
MKSKALSFLVDLVVILLGLASLLISFIFPSEGGLSLTRANYPIVISLIILFTLLVLFFDIQRSTLDPKIIPFLGVLIAINAGIRFLENAIPGPAGFSPTFFLIILTGYFFGSRIGFLMGSMTMLVSALITGGVGPWLPGQMITAGWVGQTSALFSIAAKKLGWYGKRIEILIIALVGILWGLLYGVIMNLWFWPYLGAPSGQSWLHDAGLITNLKRYFSYYLATSLFWDITRAIGNILIIFAFTRPVLKIFMRFKQRFSFSYLQEVGK